LARHQNRYLAWAAGFFEGEGCVSTKLNAPRADGFQTMYLRLSVSQTEPVQVKKLQEMFGGAVSFRESDRGHRDVWTWVVQNDAALDAMEWMAPYFIGETKWDAYMAAIQRISDHYKDEPLSKSSHNRSWMGVS